MKNLWHFLPIFGFYNRNKLGNEMSNLRYTDLLHRLPATVPFVGPETQERAMGRGFNARLGANENVFGPSPKALVAMQSAASEIWMYGDPTSFDLRQALAAHLSIGLDNIVVGEGIDGLLGYVVRMFIEAGDAVVTSDGAYPTFNFHVAGFGGVLHKVSYRNDGEDLPALIAKARETGAKLIYFANPDNPMGSWTKAEDIRAALDDLPDGTLLLLDEAYIEFAPLGTAPQIAIDDPRVLRFRTFSKAYGMAGARVGYAFGAAPLIAQFEKIRNHFGMNRVAQIGAIAALKDHGWLAETVEHVSNARHRICQIAQANGLQALPSATNFVAIDCGRDRAYATAVLNGLVARGVFVRKPFVAPQDRCIRVSAGRTEDLDLFAAALPDAIKAAQG